MAKAQRLFLFTLGITAACATVVTLMALAMGAATFGSALRLGMGFAGMMLPIYALEFGVLWYFHPRATRGKSKDGSSSVEQQRSVEIDLPYDAAFDLAQEAVTALTGTRLKVIGGDKIKARVKQADRRTGKIEGRTRSHWWIIPSLYEEMRIDIQLERVTPDVTRVHIRSQPRMSTVVFDFGYSLNNVNGIAHYLRRAVADDAITDHARLQDDADQSAVSNATGYTLSTSPTYNTRASS